MKYYILSAIVFVFGVGCFSSTEWWGGGDHALLSPELTVIIQGILLTDAVSCVFINKATPLDCTRVSQSVQNDSLSCSNVCTSITCTPWTLLIKPPSFPTCERTPQIIRASLYLEWALCVNDTNPPPSALIQNSV